MRHVRWRWRNSCSSVLADATQTSRGDHNAIRCDHRVTKIYDIGPFRLDAEALVLTEAGVPVALGSRGVAVLTALVKQPNVYVRKESIMEAAWPGVVVEENNLAVQISSIRRVLAQAPGGSILDTWVTDYSAGMKCYPSLRRGSARDRTDRAYRGKAHRLIDIRTASRISFESARSSTARARIIPPTRLAYVAIAFSRFACFERPAIWFVRNSNVDRSDSVIAFRTGAP